MYNPQLSAFLQVAEAGSFNRAAGELFITPPAVIKQINLLERGLGQDIDIVAGAFDQPFLEDRKCAGLELFRAPARCGISIYHPLAAKNGADGGGSLWRGFYAHPPGVEQLSGRYAG